MECKVCGQLTNGCQRPSALCECKNNQPERSKREDVIGNASKLPKQKFDNDLLTKTMRCSEHDGNIVRDK